MFFSKKTLKDLNLHITLSQARKIARILIVDDDEQAFPYKLLQKEGYNVSYLSKINNLKDLEAGEYDIIVLDIHGVASSELSGTDGLGIIQYLKKYNPAQLIIAYSGVKFDPNQADFWKLADDYLGKPSPLITCKEKIDELLTRSFSPTFYWNLICNILRQEGVSHRNILKCEAFITKEIESGQNPTLANIEKILNVSRTTAGIVSTVAGIIYRMAGN